MHEYDGDSINVGSVEVPKTLTTEKIASFQSAWVQNVSESIVTHGSQRRWSLKSGVLSPKNKR